MSAPAGSELDTDLELMELVAAGDRRAFEAIYDRFSGLAFSLAVRILNDRGAAADVTQEAFLELWTRGDRYQPEKGSPRAWLLGIVRNRSIDSHRRSRSRGGPPREEQWTNERVAPDNVEEDAIAGEQARIVRTALDQLPAEQSVVINLAYFGGLTQAEIAERLALPLGTVKGRVRLAMKRLQGTLVGMA